MLHIKWNVTMQLNHVMELTTCRTHINNWRARLREGVVLNRNESKFDLMGIHKYFNLENEHNILYCLVTI
jgi:hypothetical protein